MEYWNTGKEWHKQEVECIQREMNVYPNVMHVA